MGTVSNTKQKKTMSVDIPKKGEDQYRSFFNNSRDAMYVSSRDGYFVDVNNATLKLFGYTRDELVGQSVSKVYLARADRLRFQKQIERNGFVRDYEVYLCMKDGTRICCLETSTVRYSETGEIMGYHGILRDITREREIDRAKSEFVFLASHQLRTPLAAIRWYVDALLGERHGKMSGRQKLYLQKVRKSNLRMIHLVNDLLHVSKIELGTFSVERHQIRVEKVIKQMLDDMRCQIADKHLTLREVYQDNMPCVKTDHDLLCIIIQNLLSNAIKYTPEHGTITITAAHDMTRPVPDVVVSIADTGYGIPQNQRSKIFTKFFRGDNVKIKSTDGTGLGLYIVSSIAKYLGIRVWFDSIEGKGSTFYISLPLTV